MAHGLGLMLHKMWFPCQALVARRILPALRPRRAWGLLLLQFTAHFIGLWEDVGRVEEHSDTARSHTTGMPDGHACRAFLQLGTCTCTLLWL